MLANIAYLVAQIGVWNRSFDHGSASPDAGNIRQESVYLIRKIRARAAELSCFWKARHKIAWWVLEGASASFKRPKNP